MPKVNILMLYNLKSKIFWKWQIKAMILKKNSMFMQMVTFAFKSIIWGRTRTNPTRLKGNIHNFKRSGLIPIGRLRKPPYQCTIPKVMFYLTTCKQFSVTLCTYALLFHFFSFTAFSRIILFPISELIGIIASNYRLVDKNFISSIILVQVTNISRYILNR